MEIFKSEEEFRKKAKFPKYKSKNGIGAFFAYLFSILIWIGILIIGLVVLYTHWFSRNLVYLMRLIDPKPYIFPFWLALLLVVLPVTFPFTVMVILIATLVKIIKE